MWQTAAAWPDARAAAAAAGDLASPGPIPPSKRLLIPCEVLSSPKANARARTTRLRGRSSPGASASKSPRTRSAQSAAHAATRRRSASLNVCGDRFRPFSGIVWSSRSCRRLPCTHCPPTGARETSTDPQPTNWPERRHPQIMRAVQGVADLLLGSTALCLQCREGTGGPGLVAAGDGEPVTRRARATSLARSERMRNQPGRPVRRSLSPSRPLARLDGVGNLMGGKRSHFAAQTRSPAGSPRAGSYRASSPQCCALFTVVAKLLEYARSVLAQ